MMCLGSKLILLLVSIAGCCLTVSAFNDLNHDNVKQINTKKGAEKILSRSLRMPSKSSTKFAVDGAKVAKRKQLELTKQGNVDEHPNNIQYSVLDNHIPVGDYLDSNPNASVGETSSNDRVHEISTPPGKKYPQTNVIYTTDDNNEVSDEESDYILNDNKLRSASLDICKLNSGGLKSQDGPFPCPPCNCSYTESRFVIANCTKKKLRGFPFNLPERTMVLNISGNFLRYLNVSNFLSYPNLLSVTLTSNTKLAEIKNDTLGNQTSTVRILDFSSCAIRTIQDGSFDVTPELTDLIISHNQLERLTEYTFKGLGKLKNLDLSVNNINVIEIGSFNDLNRLLSLDLSGNKRLGYYEKRFSPSLFTNLKNLQKLSICSNTDGWATSYPNRTLQKLVGLQDLSIDGLGKGVEFGFEMQTLKNLVSLELSGNCQIVNITETFFENIPFLKSFKMCLCVNFAYVHPKAYTKLVHLEALSISRMKHYDIDNAFQDLIGLKNSPLKSITFKKLKKPRYQCKYLGKEHALCLKNINVEYLDLSLNEIVLLGNDFLHELPKTLKTLILRKNKFTSGTQSMNNMAVLTGLTELDLSMQNTDDYFDMHDWSTDDSSSLSCHGRQFLDIKEDSNSAKEFRAINGPEMHGFDDFAPHDNFMNTNYDVARVKRKHITFLHMPPKLITLHASHYNTFGMQILTHKLSNNSLSVIDFSNSFMSTWGNGQLPQRITKANLGYNYCIKIRVDFFQANNSHIHLNLSNNILGEDFANDTEGQIFSQLSKTTHLDISTNLIYKLPKQIFSGLRSLIYLKMTDNRLSVLNVTVAHMKTLQFIDLSRNSINWIDAETRNDFDVIAATQKKHIIKIDLTMNPLPCTCDGLELISWMATTNVHFQNKGQLMCYPDNKVAEPIGDLEERRQQLQRVCMGKSVYIIGCVAGLAVVMVTVTFGLMYRYRWKLRYLHNTAMAALLGYKPDVSPNSGCTFDAYFLYTTEIRQFVLETCLKELEVKRGHRLCVEDRDFLAGTYIVSNILSAVRNSTKTVVVMTTDLFEDPYCVYSFKMAVMEEMFKHRTVLHLLMYQQVPCDQMSHEQLEVMKRNSYIEYPPDEGADDNVRQKFWDELSQSIGHSGSNNPEPVLHIE